MHRKGKRREGKAMGIVSIIVLGFMFVVAVSRIEEAYAERFVAEHRSCCRHA